MLFFFTALFISSKGVTRLSLTKKVCRLLVSIRKNRLGYLVVAIAKNSQNLPAILCYRFATEII